MVIIDKTTVNIEDVYVEITVNGVDVEIKVDIFDVEIENFEVEDESVLPQYEADYTASDMADQMHNYISPGFLKELVKELRERLD